ncbi:MAG TPA: hypothetical protein VI385_15605 [Flavisolibacter sp.]
MRTLFLFMASMFLVVATVKAQDKIYRKNGEVLKVKILEVSSTEIKYKIFGDEDGPIYVLEKDRIQKIVYQNGRVEKPILDIKDPELYADQLKKAIKVNFFSPLSGYLQLGYEKSTGVGKSYELTMAIIGAGKNQTLDFYNPSDIQKRNQFGVAFGAGYKFNKFPDFLFGRTRFTHIMQGAYAKPVFYLGNYGENVVVNKGNGQQVVERQNVTFGALQIELGKQWVFGDRFLLDLYWGFGIGADNKNEQYNWNDEAYNYVIQRLGTSPGFAVNAGLKLGWLIK